MTCKDAKSLPIMAVCDKLDGKLVSINRSKGYALYHCPYREDRHPSLMLDLNENRWCDLATKQNGDVVDLVRLTLSLSTMEALKLLSGSHHFYIKECTLEKKKNIEPDEITIKPLSHPVLIQYVKSRGIAPEIAQRFCKEAHKTSATGKHYYTLAFPSYSGGYELRNSGYKGCDGTKDITLIGSGPYFLFFEGLFDFLSHIQLHGYDNECTYIILNSTIKINRAMYLLDSRASPKSVEAWLDNDDAGRVATSVIKQKWPYATDQSIQYASHNDLNDYLCSLKIINKNK